MCLLPQIELILAVGLKLSTKSDIKLPRSYKQKPSERENETERKQRWRGEKIKRKDLLDMHDIAAHVHTKLTLTQCESCPSGYSFLISVMAK